jgi:hypothetical protein
MTDRRHMVQCYLKTPTPVHPGALVPGTYGDTSKLSLLINRPNDGDQYLNPG